MSTAEGAPRPPDAEEPGAARPTAATAALLTALGVAIGAWSSLCGIGGGVFAVPALHYLFRLPLRTAVGSSLLLVCSSTAAATASELAHADRALRWDVVLTLIATSLVGSRVGFAVSRRLDTVRLKAVFVLCLAAVALHLALAASPTANGIAGGARAAELDLGAHALVALIGFFAGCVSPLLGVGGGLVAVPGLLLGLPSLGFLGARAASVAMSVPTSLQSLWLYARGKEVAYAFGAWLALGALAGGWLGVELVHMEGAPRIARLLLSATLAFVAARFAWDVFQARKTSAER